MSEILKKIEYYCAYQERCHKDVIDKLYKLGASGDQIDDIAAYLIANKYLDEERFVDSFISGKMRIKYWGRYKIKRALKMKDVGDFLIARCFKKIDSEEEFDILLSYVAKRYIDVCNFTYIEKSKLISKLISKGWEKAIIENVIKEHEDLSQPKV
jgi:regulatory protein